MRARIFERGVGETLSSGTGASGAAVAALLRGAASPITVALDGGELEVEISQELDLVLTGTAARVYAGELDPGLIERSRRPRSSLARRWRSPIPARRLEAMPPYMFAELERKVAAKRDAGIDVISLGIGDPDTPDLPARRRGDAGGGRRPGNPPVPVEPRPRRSSARRSPTSTAPLRGRDRPRDRGDAGDRRQGVHLQPLLRLPRPRRRRARLRPRLPGLHRRAGAGRAPRRCCCRCVPDHGFAPDLERDRPPRRSSGPG